MGILTTHSGQQLAQTSLVDFLLHTVPFSDTNWGASWLPSIQGCLENVCVRSRSWFGLLTPTAITNDKITLTWHITSSISRTSRAIIEFPTLIYLSEMKSDLLTNLQNLCRQQWVVSQHRVQVTCVPSIQLITLKTNKEVVMLCRKHVNPHFFGMKLQHFPSLSLIHAYILVIIIWLILL